MEDKNLVDKMREALFQQSPEGAKAKKPWNEKVMPGEYPRHVILPDGSSETVYGKIAIRPNGQVVPLRGHSAAQIDKILSEEGVVYLGDNMTMPGPVPTEQELIKATAIAKLDIAPVFWDRWDEKTGEREGGIGYVEDYVVVPPFAIPSVGPTPGPTIGPTPGPTTGPITGPTPGPTIGPTIGPTLPPPTPPHLIPTTSVPPHFIPETTAPAPIVPGTPDDGMGGKK